MDLGVCGQLDALPGQITIELNVLQFAGEFESTVHRNIVQRAATGDIAAQFERCGGVQSQQAAAVAPWGLDGADMDTVLLMVVNIIQPCMTQHLAFGFAAGDAADFQRIERHFHRQADALGRLGRRGLFGRRRFALNMDIAGGQAPDMQFFLPQFFRLPSEGEAGNIDIAAFGFDAPLVAVEAVYQRTAQRFRADVHAEPAGHLVKAETQAGFCTNHPGNQTGEHQNGENKQQ